ncbi:MAG: polyprenyl synthetase family protein [Clostridiales bacterium]|nr:polyprenyl synthetase family protein [Clostridiales bacterium]
MNFDKELKIRLSEIDHILRSHLPEATGYYKTVIEAMNYSLMGLGKRIRPMLMQETYRLYDKKDDEILHSFMVAIEMIHTYSLVHDDLPAMDNDEYRRGRKTTHVVYGETMAILAGDGLLNKAFEIAAGAYRLVDEDSDDVLLDIFKRILRANEILSSKAGIHGMIGGQVIDIESEGKQVTKERVDMMYHLKTSALIEASMMIGATLAGADENEIRVIENIARDIGLAFQIRDDILDVIASGDVFGKPTHSDIKNAKSTYLAIMDIEKAKEEVEVVTNRALSAYKSLPYKNEYLELLITKLINREK